MMSPRNPGKKKKSSVHSSPKSSKKNEEIRSVKLDLHNQRVIKADASRSRFIEAEHQEKLQMLLTYFCKTENINYK